MRLPAVPVVVCEAAQAGREEEPADGTSDWRGFVGEVERSRLTEDEVDAWDEAADNGREAEGVAGGTDVAGTRETLGLVVAEADEAGRVGGREEDAAVCVEARDAGRSPCGSCLANREISRRATNRAVDGHHLLVLPRDPPGQGR